MPSEAGHTAAARQAMADPERLTLPAVYSVLAPAALCEVITTAYALPAPVDCRTFRLGVNDTYLIRTAADTYLLRLYRADWRSPAAVQYEVDLLLHLQASGVPVAAPAARRDGGFVELLPAPEGPRCAVLFTYAPGTVPAATDTTNALFGRAVARLHTAAAPFQSAHPRPAADLATLLEVPLQQVGPLLSHRPADHAYLTDVAQRTRRALERLPLAALSWGVCHGDLQLKNVHMSASQVITFFDFDHGGPGWHAYDLAMVRAVQRLGQQPEAQWAAFVRGYEAVRPLGAQDVAALPLFVIAQRLYWLGFFAERHHTTPWGSYALMDPLFDAELRFIKAWLRTDCAL